MTEVNNCNIELSTGRFVHVAHSPVEVASRRQEAARQFIGLMELDRMDADGPWSEVWINPNEIVAIYPLDERSKAPDIETVTIEVSRPRELVAAAMAAYDAA